MFTPAIRCALAGEDDLVAVIIAADHVNSAEVGFSRVPGLRIEGKDRPEPSGCEKGVPRLTV
jgi:hypothetical protein